MLLSFACKKDKTIKTGVPELTTTEVSDILATSAMSGGNITSNGGESIAASGICWSKTNTTPTISDDTTKSITSSGSFTAMLKNLSSSSTYYVRAYATNRLGTGYGNVITFSTGNAAPFATNVSISGEAKADALLTGNYTYSDSEGDAESGTTFQWYSANDATGAGETAIVGATTKTFRVQSAQQGKYIRFGVTPKAAINNQNSIEFKSTSFGAIGEATTVTFVYNGIEVTYGIINSSTNKKWLDRNLGANRAAQSVDDYLAYGDYFQWGRLADGHQRVTRTNGTDAGATGVTGTTPTVSSNDVPPTDKFILGDPSVGYDWRNPQKAGLWQGVNGINNPCPSGWRLPTEAEWVAEGITTISNGYTKLKLTYAGLRDASGTGEFVASNLGIYWTASIPTDFVEEAVRVVFAPSFSISSTNRATGSVVRCIKD